jgi:hypothetical protein
MSGVGIAVGFDVGVAADLGLRFPLVKRHSGDLTTGTLFTPPGVSL